jgi:hypothetical protein
MPRTVCIVTGPPFGLPVRRFLEETVAFGAQLGKRVATFSVFDQIFLSERGRVPESRVEEAIWTGQLLDGYGFQFELLRENAYCSIGRAIDALPARTDAIVRMPASIRWRGVDIAFKDHRAIARALAPDRIVSLIDAEWKILERLEQRSEKRALELIGQEDDVDVSRVLRWLGADVSVAEDWAEWCRELTGKPVGHLVMGIAAPTRSDRSSFTLDVDNLLKAATEASLPSFYASYSMTVAGEKERKLINEAIWRLREHGFVVDPGTIEIGGEITDVDRPITFAYTVFRDLRWDVQKVDVVAAFHPYEDRDPPISTGMMDELGHARALGKDRYLVLPRGGGSPFTAGTYIPRNHAFKTAEEFFDFIEKRRRPQLKPRFKESVAAFAKREPDQAPVRRPKAKKA